MNHLDHVAPGYFETMELGAYAYVAVTTSKVIVLS